MAQQVLIIGAGVLGTALARAIPSDRTQISFWDTDAAKCPGGGCLPLEQTVPAADWVFLCIPSWAVRAGLAPVAALLRPATTVVSMAKGLESQSGKTMPEVCTEVLPPHQPFAVLGGALLASEIGTGLPGMGVVACADDGLAANLLALFQGSALQLAWSSDPQSVSLAGVLKNVYALILGIGDGLGLGSNARGWLFAQAVREMLEIGKLLHADPQVLLSVAGIGDLVATGLSDSSKNHAAGVQLARTGRAQTECEGIMSFPAIRQKVGSRPGLRLLDALEAILAKGQNVRTTVQDLLYRRA